MLALTSRGPGTSLELSERAEPTPLPHEAVVDAEAVSVNRGEVQALELGMVPAGRMFGSDVAGVVRHAAADGSGPVARERVVGARMPYGTWAQQVAVPTHRLAVLPETVGFAQAATLPIAGGAALRMLDRCGFCAGKRVLVIGASGGVGSFAVQLAQLAGAHVTAVTSNRDRVAGLRELGADAVLDELTPDGDPFDLIFDGVGGRSTGAAMQRVADYGTVVVFASSDDRDVTYPAGSFRARPGARVCSYRHGEQFDAEHNANRDLHRLLTLLADGRLVAPIGVEASWREPNDILQALLDRRIAGKAVLHVD